VRSNSCNKVLSDASATLSFKSTCVSRCTRPVRTTACESKTDVNDLVEHCILFQQLTTSAWSAQARYLGSESAVRCCDRGSTPLKYKASSACQRRPGMHGNVVIRAIHLPEQDDASAGPSKFLSRRKRLGPVFACSTPCQAYGRTRPAGDHRSRLYSKRGLVRPGDRSVLKV
jgi:hypothetical protein